MSPRTPFIYPPAGGGGVEWATLLDADFSGTAGSALADGGTLVRSGVTWTLRAQSASFQTWTPAADGIDIAVTDTTATTNALLADIADAKILGRNPDEYDVIAAQALWVGVTQAESFLSISTCLGHEDLTVPRAKMDRPLIAGHARNDAPRWWARLSNSGGLIQQEEFLATGLGDPVDVPVVTGGIFMPGLGVQVFGGVDRSTLYGVPADLRGVSIMRKPGAAERPQIDRVGVFAVSFTSLTNKTTLSRIRIQHFRLPGAPDPA